MPNQEPNNSVDSLATRLRIAREMSGLTQNQSAEILGLHRPSVTEIEAGRRKVSTEELKKFAMTYGVSTSWLLADSELAEKPETRIRLAARELASLREEDLERILSIVRSLKGSGEQN